MSDDKKQKRIQQIPFRLHVNDHAELKSKAALDGIKIQTLVEAACLAYLDGDDHVRQLAREFKKLSTVNKKKVSWSRREQENLLTEIEESLGSEDE